MPKSINDFRALPRRVGRLEVIWAITFFLKSLDCIGVFGYNKIVELWRYSAVENRASAPLGRRQTGAVNVKKSSFVFIIMAVVYLAIAISGGVGWLTIPDNILLGLSLSALFSAISDILYNIGWKSTVRNNLDYTIRVAVEFLTEKQANNTLIANPNINIVGVRQAIKEMSNNYQNARHPVDYDKKRFITIMKVGSQISFIISITIFICSPFLSLPFNSSFSSIITLVAFSAMCFNLYLVETISEIINKRNDFLNKEQLIIQIAYPDFFNYFNVRLQAYVENDSKEEKDEVKTDAHS